jgi:opacity protein-like surface antigen
MKLHRHRFIEVVAVAGILVAVSIGAPDGSRAAAASSSASDSASTWVFEFTPYFWLAGIKGHADIGDFSTNGVEVSFSDLFESLELGLMGTFEAQRGQWGAVFDGMYIKLENQKSTNSPAGAVVELDLTQQIYEGGFLYRAVDQSGGDVDIIGGARFLVLESNATVQGGVFDGRTAGSDENWVDAFIGVRGAYSFARRWSASGYADIGAGGSDLTWQALAGIAFHISEMFSAKAGYRYLGYKFENADLSYDLSFGGAILGLGIRF